MSNSLIGAMRESNPLMHSTTVTVVLTFLTLICQPTIAAATDSATTTTPTTTASSAEAQYSKTLQRIEDKLAKLEDKFVKQLDGTLERNDLKQLEQTLKQLDQTVRQGFQKVEQHITDKKLAAVIMQRHQAMVTNYQAEYQALIAELDAVESATDETQRHQHAQAALNRLKGKKNKRSQQPFDPNQLPNSTLKPDPNNKPKETEAAFTQAGLYNTPYQNIAALGDFTFDKLAGADNPAYLAETVEVTLSQAIKDKAAELNHDPVKIYHWVRNNTEWLPTWGGIQDADLTLSSQRGNAMDIASLTIALLRASKIPARYVHGTIDVKADAFNNWMGNFTNINAAADYASSGGIPTTGIISGGHINKVRMEHLWVEAAIDYQPSRGAINKDADSWVQMDPSYKQYEYLTELDTLAISEIDPETLAQSFIDSGTVNESEGWVTGFNPAILEAAQTQAQQKLEAYIQNNLTDPTVGDVIGGRKTIIKEYPVLPSSLPNPIKVTGTRYDKLPGQLQQTITYGFIKGILGDISDPLSFPWAELNNKKVTLSFKPATQADEDALASLLPDGEITDISQLPSSIPSYLVNVVPELKVEGQVVKTGGAMKLGEDLDFTTAVKFAGRGQLQSPKTYQVIAGSYLSVNVFAGSVSSQKLLDLRSRLEQTKAKLENADQTQIAALTREDLLGDLFQSGSLGYYSQYLALNNLLGLQVDGHYQLAAGTGTVGYEPNVDYFFGFPRSINPGGVAFDIPLVNISTVNDADAEKKKQFVIQSGLLSSALEHAVPEQMFTTDPTNPLDAISAVKALAKANASGQRIYTITQTNSASILGNIHHHQSTMDEIRAALSVGKEVITHTDAVSVPGWSGAGYIILDPVTGEGAYKIGGGANGGWIAAALLSFALPLIGLLLAGAGPLALILAGVGAYFGINSYLDVVGEILSLMEDGSLTVSEAEGSIKLISFLTIFLSFMGFSKAGSSTAADKIILTILPYIVTILNIALKSLITDIIPFLREK